MDVESHVSESRSSVGEPGSLHLLKRIEKVKESAPRIEWLWNQLKTQDYAFDDFRRGNSDLWLQSLFTPNSEHYEFGDDGYALIDNIVPHLNANLHFCVWGKRAVSEVVAAGRELITYAFHVHELNRMTALCPVHNRQASRFALLLKFKFEGELRKAFLYHEEYYNVSCYGLLRSEWFKKEEVQ